MCDGSTPVDVPLATTRTTQVAITYQDAGIFGTAQKWPDPITVTGALNVTGADAIILQDHSTNGFFTTLPQGYTSITNNGSITSTGGYGINNQSSLTTLNNAQGGNSSTPATSALTYTGNLPTNYNIIINSPTYYGQLALTNLTGTNFNFGIDSSSIVTTGTYRDVLQGLSTIDNVTGATGSFAGGAYIYSLQYDASQGAANDWNLVVSAGLGGVAPEMNASFIPQVGLLLGCLFFLVGRKKEVVEPMLTA